MDLKRVLIVVSLLVIATLLTGCFGGGSGGGLRSGLGGGSTWNEDQGIVGKRSSELFETDSVEDLERISDYLANRVSVRVVPGKAISELLLKLGVELDEPEEWVDTSNPDELNHIYSALHPEYLFDREYLFDLDAWTFGDIVVSPASGGKATASRRFETHVESYLFIAVVELTWQKTSVGWQLTSIVIRADIEDSGDGSDGKDDDSDGVDHDHEIDFDEGKRIAEERSSQLRTLYQQNQIEKARGWFAETIDFLEVDGEEPSPMPRTFDDLLASEVDHHVFDYMLLVQELPGVEVQVIRQATFRRGDDVVYQRLIRFSLDDNVLYGQYEFAWRYDRSQRDWLLYEIAYGYGDTSPVW